MKTYVKTTRNASVADFRARLSAHLKAVKAGEEVLILERGRPVARVVPVAGEVGEDERLDALVRSGLVREPRTPFPADFLEISLPPDPEGRGVQGLLEERAEGR